MNFVSPLSDHWASSSCGDVPVLTKRTFWLLPFATSRFSYKFWYTQTDLYKPNILKHINNRPQPRCALGKDCRRASGEVDLQSRVVSIHAAISVSVYFCYATWWTKQMYYQMLKVAIAPNEEQNWFDYLKAFLVYEIPRYNRMTCKFCWLAAHRELKGY